jgi:hypothetical protein
MRTLLGGPFIFTVTQSTLFFIFMSYVVASQIKKTFNKKRLHQEGKVRCSHALK